MGKKETKRNGRVYLQDDKTGQLAGSRPLPVSPDPAYLTEWSDQVRDPSDENPEYLTVGIDSVYEIFAQKQAKANQAIVEEYLSARTAYDDAVIISSKRFDAYKEGLVSKEVYAEALAGMHRARFAYQTAERKYQETPEGQAALQEKIEETPDSPARQKAERELATARSRAVNRAASQEYADKGDTKTAQVVLAHGADYAWASAAEFDLREAVFTPYAVTRSGTETDYDNDSNLISREKIESFLQAVPLSTGINPENPNMNVTIYGIPAYSENDGDRLVVIAETSPVVQNYTVGTLTKEGKLLPRNTEVLSRFMEEEQGPVSRHTGLVVDDWTYHVTSKNHAVAGLSMTATTTWDQADPADFRDEDRNDER